MARVAIVGVGAIGGVAAGLLQQAGSHELILCTRRPITGPSVETPDGVVSVQGAVLTDPKDATAVDWVLVATKAYDVAGAAQWLDRLCSGARLWRCCKMAWSIVSALRRM
jgi:2-dehydropantoate 2-reductase